VYLLNFDGVEIMSNHASKGSLKERIKSGENQRPLTGFRWRFPRLKERQIVWLAGISILLALICTITAVVSIQPPSPTTTPMPLGQIGARAAVDYLKSLSVPISNVRSFQVPNENWMANEEIQFDVQRGTGKGTFILLSYDSGNKASLDAFKASGAPKYKNWTVAPVSNLLLLALPDTADSLQNEIASHLTQKLIAPYRLFVATATPTQ
jgi:hypothetical protein